MHTSIHKDIQTHEFDEVTLCAGPNTPQGFRRPCSKRVEEGVVGSREYWYPARFRRPLAKANDPLFSSAPQVLIYQRKYFLCVDSTDGGYWGYYYFICLVPSESQRQRREMESLGFAAQISVCLLIIIVAVTLVFVFFAPLQDRVKLSVVSPVTELTREPSEYRLRYWGRHIITH